MLKYKKILILGMIFGGISCAMEIPKILVNHDLWAHERNSGDGINRDEGGYSTKLTPSKIVELLNFGIEDVHSKDMKISLNTVYGAHNIAYWYPENLLKNENITSYKNWFDEMKLKILGESPISIESITNDTNTNIDNLIKYKLLGSSTELFSRLEIDENKKLIVSYRINDYHHLDNVIDFKNAIDNKRTIDLENNSRQFAAISPEYMYFLNKGKVISTQKGLDNHGIGKKGMGKGRCHDYPVLDMGDSEVLLHKKREINKLLMLRNVGGVEIDFTRSPCMFSALKGPVSKALIKKERGDKIRNLLAFVINMKKIKNKKLILNFPREINWTDDFGFNIRSFIARNHRNIDVVITGGSIGLSSTLPEKDPFDLLSLRDKFHRLGETINTKFYHQINHIVDAYNKHIGENETIQIRRPISLKELRGITSLVKYFGYDGINLYNFQYLFPMQRQLNFDGHQKVTWGTLSRLFSNSTDIDKAGDGKAYYISGDINNLRFKKKRTLTVKQVLPKGNTLNGSTILLRIKTKLNTNLTVSVNDRCKVTMRNEDSLSGLHPLEHMYRDTNSKESEQIKFWVHSDFIQYAWIKTNCLLNTLDENEFVFKSNSRNEELEFIEILEKNS